MSSYQNTILIKLKDLEIQLNYETSVNKLCFLHDFNMHYTYYITYLWLEMIENDLDLSNAET